MYDLNKIIITAIVSGVVMGAILAASHFILRHYELHPVANYAFGSFWVFAGISEFLLVLTDNWLLVFGCWLILGICGMFVAVTYAVDKAMNEAGRMGAKNEANQSEL